MNRAKTIGMFRLALGFGLTFLLLAGIHGPASAKEFVVGAQCDRSGATQTVGAFLCDGSHDYIKLFNKKNMLGGGHTIRWMRIRVPQLSLEYKYFLERILQRALR